MVGALLSIGAVDLGSGEECYMHNAHPSVLDAPCTMHIYLPSDEAHFARHRACLLFISTPYVLICQLNFHLHLSTKSVS